MRRSWLVRIAALLLGFSALAMLIRFAGAEAVAEHVQAAAPILVWMLVLEVIRLVAEVFATALQLGRYTRPLGRWTLIRGHLLSYATNTLAPAGRVAGEAIKAASYAPVLGAAVSAAMAIRIQAASLFAGGAMSALCAPVAHTLGAPSWLAIGLVVHTILAVAAGALLLQCGHGAARKTLGRLRAPLASMKRGFEALPRVLAGPVILFFVGRCLQVVQMALLLSVVVGLPTPAESLVLEGLFMVGTAAGDFIPGQVGATDTALALGGSSIALSASAGLAIASAIRVVQLAMASACSLVVLASRPRRLSAGHSAARATSSRKHSSAPSPSTGTIF
jgi:hypothetical protein